MKQYGHYILGSCGIKILSSAVWYHGVRTQEAFHQSISSHSVSFCKFIQYFLSFTALENTYFQYY